MESYVKPVSSTFPTASPTIPLNTSASSHHEDTSRHTASSTRTPISNTERGDFAHKDFIQLFDDMRCEACQSSQRECFTQKSADKCLPCDTLKQACLFIRNVSVVASKSSLPWDTLLSAQRNTRVSLYEIQHWPMQPSADPVISFQNSSRDPMYSSPSDFPRPRDVEGSIFSNTSAFQSSPSTNSFLLAPSRYKPRSRSPRRPRSPPSSPEPDRHADDTDSKGIKCSCGKVFGTTPKSRSKSGSKSARSNLKRHIDEQANRQRFPCRYPGCGYASARAENLESHIQKRGHSAKAKT